MENDVFISYIVPCYNVQDYLPKCLEALSIQKIASGAKIEYIFVNDGSQDATLYLLNDFVAQDDRAKIIDQPNQGVCAARNNGLQLARGKYVFFLDGDDYLTDEASQSIYDAYNSFPSDIIILNAYAVCENNADRKTEWNTFAGSSPSVYQTQDFARKVRQLPISVKAYKRETLVKNNVLFDEDLRVGEVYTFFVHAMAFSDYITLSESRVMNWVIRSAGTTKGLSVGRDSEILKTMRRIDKYSGDFAFDLKSQSSYQASVLGIANLFSLAKYMKPSKYNKEVERFLIEVTHDEIYRRALKHFLFERPRCNVKFLKVLIIYCIPIKPLYRLLTLINRN